MAETVTGKLAANMASVKKEMAATMRAMQQQTKEIDARHDEAAEVIADLDRQLADDPHNEELLRKRGEYDRVREGLYAASEYGTGLIQQMTGGPLPEPKRHNVREPSGQFVKRNSIGDHLRRFVDLVRGKGQET